MLVRIGGALLSGLLLGLTVGLHPYWWAAWLAPLLLLLTVLKADSDGEARLLYWGAAILGHAGNFSYYLTTNGPGAATLLLTLQVLAWVFYIGSARRALLRKRNWWVVLVLPVRMATLDFLIGAFSPHGAWGSLAITQVDALPVLQIASFAGSPGIVFLIGLFASVVALWTQRKWDLEGPVLAYGVPLLLLLSSLGFGFWRLSHAVDPLHQKVGIVALDATPAAWDTYAAKSKALSQAGAKLLLWPEKIEKLQGKAAAARQAWAGELARELQVGLVLGVQVEKRNVAWIFNPEGDWVGEYQKQYLVPYSEADLQAGKKDGLYAWKGRKYGVAVCRDFFFAKLARSYGKQRIEAMLSPAWDFGEDARMASAVVTLMGVAGGYPVVRASREGFLHASDSYGRVLLQQKSSGAALVDLPLSTAGGSVYAGLGDYFAYLCIVSWLWMAVLSTLRHPKVVDYLTGTGCLSPSI